MKYFLSLVVFVFMCTTANAQVLTRDWVSYFSGQLTCPIDVEYEPINDCIYVLGVTANDTGIATVGAHRDDFGDIEPPPIPFSLLLWKADLFLSKYSTDGTMIWSTYIGGTEKEGFPSLKCDYSGNVYVAGMTASPTGIATADGHQPSKEVDTNHAGFLMKFSPSGDLLWGTYYAETIDPIYGWGMDIAIDSFNNVYLGSTTELEEGIATLGAFQPNLADSADMYVVKFDSTGQRQWGTYIGGMGVDILSSLVVDRNGDLLVTGSTTSIGMGTAGTFMPTYPGAVSALLIKLDAEEGTRIWSTYFGDDTAMTDIRFGSIDSDAAGNIYVFGKAVVHEDLATEGTHQEDYGGGANDAVLMKFTKEGQRVWGTYFGGEGTDSWSINWGGIEGFPIGASLRVSADGSRIFICGGTESTTQIETEICGYEPTTSNRRGFIAEFDSTGQLNWGSYYDEQINSIDIAEGNGKGIDIYFATRTNIPGLGTAGAHRPNYDEGLYSSGLIGKFSVNCLELEAGLSFTGTALEGSDHFTTYTWYHNEEEVSTGSSASYLPGTDTTGYYYYQAKACGCVYNSDTFFFDPLGIPEEELAGQLQLYPNPATDELHLRLPNALSGAIWTLSITDIHGRKVQEQTVHGNECRLNIQKLPAGIYLLEVQYQDRKLRKKFVKR